jgi:hypothetical protein
MALFGGMFGDNNDFGPTDPAALYGGLLSPKQNSALSYQGLLAAAGALGQAAMPSRMPIPTGAALGMAAGAMGQGQQSAAENAMKGSLLGLQGQHLNYEMGMGQHILNAINNGFGSSASGSPGNVPGEMPAAAGGGNANALPSVSGNSDLLSLGQKVAAKYGIPWDVFSHQIAGESGWNPNVGKSSAGAQGLAQFIPDTAKKYGVDVTDPQSSLDGAARYMRDLYDQSGSWTGALTGYLSGKPGPELTSVSSQNPQYAAAYVAARQADQAGNTGKQYAQAGATDTQPPGGLLGGQSAPATPPVAMPASASVPPPVAMPRGMVPGGAASLNGADPRMALMLSALGPMAGLGSELGQAYQNTPAYKAAQAGASTNATEAAKLPFAGPTAAATAGAQFPFQQGLELAKLGMQRDANGNITPIPGYNQAAAGTKFATAAAEREAAPPILRQESALPIHNPVTGKYEIALQVPKLPMGAQTVQTPNGPEVQVLPGINKAISEAALAQKTGEAGAIPLTGTNEALNKEYHEDVVQPSDHASMALEPLTALQNAMKNYQSGPGAQTALALKKAWQQVGQTTGLFTPGSDAANDIAKGEILNKEGTTLGFELARSLGSRESQMIIQQAIQTNPGLLNSPQGNQQLVGLLKQNMQRDLDKRSFWDNWYAKNGNYNGAKEAFDFSNPVEMYVSKAVPYQPANEQEYNSVPRGATYWNPNTGKYMQKPLYPAANQPGQ